MAGTNIAVLSGRISRTPKRVPNPRGQGTVYVFPLAVRIDGDEQLVFPVIVTPELPRFCRYRPGRRLHHQQTVTVHGQVVTRNLTRPLHEAVAAQADRSGAPQATVDQLRTQIRSLADGELVARRVIVEVLAERIAKGGAW